MTADSAPGLTHPRKRRWLIAAAVGSVTAAIWGIARGTEKLDTTSWVAVERRDLVISVDLEGELQAVRSADLGPPQVSSIWDFKISFMAPEGTEVAKATPVLGFDTTRLQQQLQEKIAERDSAAKELEKRTTDLEIRRRDKVLELAEAEARHRRAELKLATSDLVTPFRDIEEARIDHGLAQLEIGHARSDLEHQAAQGRSDLAALVQKRDRAAARVAEIEAQIGAMTVKAPRAGTVIYSTGQRGGDKKKIGDSVWRAETVIQIPDLESMLGEGEVAEADSGRLATGQPVTLRLDAYPDRQYAATVKKIRRTVQEKSRRNSQKVMRLLIELQETDTERMRPGMRFRGKVETGRVRQALVIPQEAAFPRPEGTAVVVRTLFGRREIFPTFGERNDDLFAVTSELEEGDKVLLRGAP